ncbi:hypothetical protein [Oryzomonas rubra]|uniref:Uncharacterized protein n=1 Tax=Oryzomonas rubra TaxID=2509454 RepID=A0A5A9X977_9BACT|nr:hypothetical protein [Oryzomonas rubra]KAA0888759.1 hypothetical protein ET418_15375 [Oryzomonas rubra]
MATKTIEIASIHKGDVNICTKSNEQRTITFEDKGAVGLALVDNDEAEILLEIGLPNYWKPTVNGGSASDSSAASDDSTVKVIATVLIEQINAAETAEAVDVLVGDDTRKTVLAAATARKAALAPAE